MSTAHFEPALDLCSDGPRWSPLDSGRLLVSLAERSSIGPDTYLAGGAVEILEARFAQGLGKERALFLPTGTLANHLALRRLAQGKTRVLVQAESHLYRDSVDCVQVLSGLNLVPLAAGRTAFGLGEVEQAVQEANAEPHAVAVGAISIESPVRRALGERFDFGAMKQISGFARERGIGLHLDGARLFVESAYSGIAPAQYAELFDSVYVSLYKSFGAPAGAILAGPSAFIEGIAQDRKRFGADLYQAWPNAAVALHGFEGFFERFKRGVEAANALFARLNEHPRLKIEPIPNGTNVYRLHVKDVVPAEYQAALALKEIRVRTGYAGVTFAGFWLVVNETWSQRPVEKLAQLFFDALPP